jgi:type VI protein secretion system component VasF
MQEKVIRRLHDVLGYGLELKERIEQGEVPRVEVEHDKLRTILLGDGELAQNAAYNGELAGLPQQATGTQDFGRSDRFLGARYALACWLDEIFILDCPPWWAERWEANTMEAALYGGTQQRAWRFWDQARKAEGPRGSSEALEAYLWAVMLGFRGGPPGDLNPATWVDAVKKRVLAARSAEFPIPPEREVPTSVPPLRGKERFTRMLRVAAVVLALAAFALGLAATSYFGK